MSSPISDDTLARLGREREQADKIYNAALTAVDRALPGRDPQPPLGEDVLRLWQTAPADPLASLTGWRRRLAGFVWRFLGPMLQQQQQFNHAVAYHLAAPQAAFDSEVIHFLQQITLMVDSKDREAAATINRHLSDGLSALADAIAKRWESMLARDQRYEARMSDLADIRASIASLQQASYAMKRELERLIEAPRTEHSALSTSTQHPAPGTSTQHAAPGTSTQHPAPSTQHPAPSTSTQHPAPSTEHPAPSTQHPAPSTEHPAPGTSTQHPAPSTQHPWESYVYVGFEDRFRGSLDDIRARLNDYLPCFEGASDVLDVGCGRGEFLQLLAGRGVKGRGIDLNHEMVEACRAGGLDVVEGDALDYLASLPDGSLGGLFAAQVVEHLDPDRLIRLLGVAFGKLRPGSRIVLETINPACWAAFFDSYIRDLTHVRPIHPETLKYLLQASGFQAPDIRYRSPYPEFARLQPVAIPDSARLPSADWSLVDVAETFNENVEKLNSKLFTHLDYAAIATRG